MEARERELVKVDPRRAVLRERARAFLSAGMYAEFRDWVDRDCRAWRCSPSALQLVGGSFFLEGEFDEAVRCLDEAESQWRNLGKCRAISARGLARILASVARCREKLALEQSHRRSPSNTRARAKRAKAVVTRSDLVEMIVG